MNEIEYKKKCDAIFQKAKLLNLELAFEPDNFDPQRLNCLWHGGRIAKVIVSDKLSIEISVCGDVHADLYDGHCNHIVHMKDKGNNAVFADVMGRHIKNDADLNKAIECGRLELDYNNWIEYDGFIRDESDLGKTSLYLPRATTLMTGSIFYMNLPIRGICPIRTRR